MKKLVLVLVAFMSMFTQANEKLIGDYVGVSHNEKECTVSINANEEEVTIEVNFEQGIRLIVSEPKSFSFTKYSPRFDEGVARGIIHEIGKLEKNPVIDYYYVEDLYISLDDKKAIQDVVVKVKKELILKKIESEGKCSQLVKK